MSGSKLHDTRVAIVGAGTAGLTAALVLARAGIDVVLCERNDDLERAVCGEYLCPAGVTTVRELGLEEVIAAAPVIEGMRLVSPSGRVVHCPFPCDGRHGVGVSLNKQEFHRQLARRAQQAGAQLRFAARVSAIERDADGWRLSLGADGERLRAEVLLGADGRRSGVAEVAGLALPPEPRARRVAIRAFVVATRTPERCGEMHIFAGGSYIGVNPIAREEINVSLVCDPATLQRAGGAREALLAHAALSADLSARFDWSDPRGLRSVTPISARVRAASAARVALIGDASGFVDPLTGEGIYVALWSGVAAADGLAAALCAGDDPDLALAAYGRSRRQLFRAKARVSRGFQTIIRRRWLCEAVGRYLAADRRRAEGFIGIVGNNYTPAEGLGVMLGGAPLR